MLLKTYFDFLYPTDLVIGNPSKFIILETSAAAVQDLLPQEGRPAPLTASYTDPASRLLPEHKGKYGHHRRLGSLAGEVLALELNVRFSAYCLTRCGLGSLHLASGKLAGWTVDQVLAAGNRALGGDPLSSISSLLNNYDDLDEIIGRINKNFRAGTTNNHYLVP
jgi:hypothetical protein